MSLIPLLAWAVELSFTGSFLLARAKQILSVVLIAGGRSGKLAPVGKLLLLLSLDLSLGLSAATLILPVLPPSPSGALLLRPAEMVVSRLRLLLSWLMGAPAGLKLNSVLSGALGRFFLYHVHLWVTFLHLAAPHLARAISAGTGVLVRI